MMSSSALQHILELIDGLSDSDREALERQILDRAEAEWQHEVRAARRMAAERGINQAAIDSAVNQARYGS